MPHGCLGSTPHYAKFGCELIFTGWQEIVKMPSQEEISGNIKKNLLKSLVRNFIRNLDKLAVVPKSTPLKLEIGLDLKCQIMRDCIIQVLP